MRVVLEALLCFATACLVGTLSRWSFVLEAAAKLTASPRTFMPSPLHGVQLSKAGPVALTRWRETNDGGRENWFPKRKKPVVGVDSPVEIDCSITINADNGVWVDAIGMSMLTPNGSFGDWVLTRRNVEETVHQWRDSRVMTVVWHPYVRFVAFYERIVAGLTEAAMKLSFQDFCTRPLAPCPEGLEPWQCTSIILSASSYLRSQSLCTHDDAMHPVIDILYDAGALSGSYTSPDLKAMGDITRQEISKVVRRMREPYLKSVKTAEMLYRAYPSCLDRVYEFYHSDFLLLGYSKLKIV